MNEQNVKRYFHSVQLIEDKCKGCVNCIKHCPTEAIRVRDGKAQIHEIKCVDCGECIRMCPNQAKTAVADTLDSLSRFRHTVALPAPALYGQFPGGVAPERVLAGLLSLGFDDVFEVAYGAEFVGARIRELLADPSRPRPLLSSSCPAIVRLIQVRFPEFVDNIAPVVSPMRMAARMVRKQKSVELDIPENEIGLFFISPCPGKVSAILDPVGFHERCVDGAIPISEIYGKLHNFVYGDSDDSDGHALKRASGMGIGWGRSGGEILAIGAKKHISVDGIHHVIKILEEMSHGRLRDMDYIETLACVGGCVGGVLTVENPFISRRRIRDLTMANSPPSSDAEVADRQAELIRQVDRKMLDFDKKIEPRPSLSLDEDMNIAIQKLEQMEEMLESLPGLDCGSCGAPDCRALAEDIARGLASDTDCIFRLREQVHQLADKLQSLASKLPPSMGLVKKEDTSDAVIGDSEGAVPDTKD